MLVDSSIPEADPEGRMRVRRKPEQDPVTLAAKRSYLGRVYLDWAKYPITETEPVENSQAAYVVRFQDLRYDYPDQTRRGVLSASVKLDRDLNVVTESFGSRGRRVATERASHSQTRFRSRAPRPSVPGPPHPLSLPTCFRHGPRPGRRARVNGSLDAGDWPRHNQCCRWLR